MRKLLLISLLLNTLCHMAMAQDMPPPPDLAAWARDSIKPYQKDPVLPAFNIRLMDSATVFNTFNIPRGNPVGIIFFDPDCKHCKHTIGLLLRGMDSVKDVHFYLISAVHDMYKLRNFYDEFGMSAHKNIRMVGRDYEFFFFNHYHTISVPDIVLYDDRKKLIKLIEGEFSATDIYKLVH